MRRKFPPCACGVCHRCAISQQRLRFIQERKDHPEEFKDRFGKPHEAVKLTLSYLDIFGQSGAAHWTNKC